MTHKLYIRADSAATPRRQPYQSQYEGNKPLSSLPSNAALRRAVVGQIQIFEFKFKFKFRVPAVAVTKAVTAADGSAADPALGCGASRSAPWA